MSEDGAEQRYVKEAFDMNWVVPLGPNVNGFEADLENFMPPSPALPDSLSPDPSPKGKGESASKRVVALSSGTAAVHLGLLCAGVKPGDEVIVQSFTFCASTHPVTYLGAKPVLVDSEPDTWNIDPELLEEAIKDRIAKTGKKPAAIVPVALYGMPYKADRIMEIANKYGIPVVEDAAEGFGSRYKGQVLGTFGKYGVLNFNGNKMITTSGGGALITEDEDHWREVMMYATQYRESYPYYQHEKIGYNYRMSNICAGIGRGQMTVLEDHLKHHKHVQKMYEELLKDVKGIKVHSQPDEWSMVNGQWFTTRTTGCVQLRTGAVGGAAGVIHAAESAHTDCEPNANVEAMRVALDRANIEARPVWKPMHKQPCYLQGNVKIEKCKNENISCVTSDSSIAYVNGVSEALFKVGMCLPAGPYVTDDDVRYIVDTIKAAIERA